MKNAWSRWKFLAGKVGNIQANIFLTIIYFLLIVPISLLRKLKANRKSNELSYWVSRPKTRQDIRWAKRQ